MRLLGRAQTSLCCHTLKQPEKLKTCCPVAGRTETCLLVETMEAVESIEEIVALDGIDYIHVGLNDIHIQRGTRFMFEFLSDGLMDQLAKIIKDSQIPFGFGVGRTLHKPTGQILAEHSRLGSTGVSCRVPSSISMHLIGLRILASTCEMGSKIFGNA